MNKKILLWVVGLIILAGVGLALSRYNGAPEGAPPVVSNVPKDWKVMSGDGLSFAYPAEFDVNYIVPKIWPPQGYILSASGPLPCAATPAGQTVPAGQSVQKVVNGHTYCVTTVNETATTSIATQYAYVFKSDEKIVALLMSLRFTQCASVSTPERKIACEEGRKHFDLDAIVDGIAQTFKVGKLEETPKTMVAPAGS